MKIGVILVLVSYVSADCGCLKCSRHLQGVDVPGPAGFPVKVIFRRPKPIGCGCGCSCGCREPIEPLPKVEEPCHETPGGPYSATVQIPLFRKPKPRVPCKNLKYRTDTILISPPPTVPPNAAPCSINPPSLTTDDILKWLRKLQLEHQLAAAKPVPQPPFPCAQCQQCQQCKGNPPLETRDFSADKETPQCLCCSCQRSKRSVTLQENTFEDQSMKKILSSAHSTRGKRDLAKRGYDLFMKSLPQFVREPLHHSVQGINYLQQPKPKPSLKQLLNDIKTKKSVGVVDNLYNQHKSQTKYILPQRTNLFNQPSLSPRRNNANYFQQSNPTKYPFLDKYSDPVALSYRRPKNILLEKPDNFGSTNKSPKFPFSNRDDPLENRKYSILESRPKQSLLFGKTGASVGSLPSTSFRSTEPLLDDTYKTSLQKYDSHRSHSSTPKLSQRLEEKEDANEKTLLKKLKKLNNNPFISNLEDQATDFMQQLLKPEESKNKNKRFSRDRSERELSRKKRTIIIGSDEMDLPTHYEVEMVGAEDDSEENQPQEMVSIEEFEDEDPIVGISPFMRKLAPPRRFYPSLPILHPKPEIVLGKNVIQKAVREELEAHHRKLEREQKLKEMKENLQRKKKQQIGIPQNPIFALLTAPVQFLKHFHNLNRGVSTGFSTIPKLVYSTKKVFRDLGKNIQRNCLDLASNVVGDFDHVHPSVIQQIVEPDGRRYRRDVLKPEQKNGVKANEAGIDPNKENTEKESNKGNKNKIFKETKALESDDIVFQGNKTKSFVMPEGLTEKNVMKKGDKRTQSRHKNGSGTRDTRRVSNSSEPVDLEHLKKFVNNNKQKLNQTSDLIKKSLMNKPETDHFAPEYTLAFENSKETTNFREVPDKHVRKKRYVVRVVDDDDIQDQVEAYLRQKLGDQYHYPNPLQGYYDKVNAFLNKLYSSHQPLCQIGEECYYHRPAPVEETYEDHQESSESLEDSYEEKPIKKKIQIRKTKPRVIIDNKGRPFMEYNGYNRPLMLHGKKFGMLKKTSQRDDSSSEETGNKIASLIARAKVDSEVVGNAHKDIIPQQIIKERISSLLEEIDQLVHLNAEKYDDIFDDLIKIEHIKTSIEQDWKRMLIDNRVNDIGVKIGLLSKFKDLQQVKDRSVRKIAAALKKNDNEFVRCQLVNSLIRLQKLQCLITSVVNDFEQHLKMKTSFNPKKEIKYVDYLSDLKFAFAKTRNDLMKMLSKDRDLEGQKSMEMLHKLKKLLISADGNQDKFDHAAKLLWEMKNLEKLQIETIKDMNQKLSRNFKIKKELKILFDMQRRFEDCNKELCEFLTDVHVKERVKNVGQKKDIKEVIEEVKRRHGEMWQKAKGRSSNLLKKS